MAHDVISAFLDNEPFEPEALAASLATEDGRQLLIDLVALRHIVSGEAGISRSRTRISRRARPWLLLAGAAVVCLALGGGYVLGHRMSDTAAPRTVTPPAPTRVIDLQPGVDWHLISGGR